MQVKIFARDLLLRSLYKISTGRNAAVQIDLRPPCHTHHLRKISLTQSKWATRQHLRRPTLWQAQSRREGCASHLKMSTSTTARRTSSARPALATGLSTSAISQEPFCVRPRMSPDTRRHTFCASLRSRITRQHFTKGATLYGNLEHEKCRTPKTAAQTLCEPAQSKRVSRFHKATLYGNCYWKKCRRPEWAPWSSTGLYITVRTTQCGHTVWGNYESGG